MFGGAVSQAAMMAALLLAAVLQAGGGPRTGPAPPVSLLVNGSFEEGPRAGRFVNLAGGSTAIRGWVVTGEGIDYIGTLWPGSEGVHSIDLDGSARSPTVRGYVKGGVAQTFVTAPGTRYEVSFDLAGNPHGRPAKKLLRVSAAGQSQDLSFDITGKRPMGWTPTRWSFAAKAASTTLEFSSLMPVGSTGWGAAIDNVVVTALADAAPLEVRESAKEIEVRLGAEILFATAEYTLRPAAGAALERVAALLKDHPGLPVMIQGHTDNVGSPAANQLLSERRARAVKEWLVVQAGISKAAITTEGRGETAPVATNTTPAGRQQNRRVEIRLQKAP